MVDNLAAEIHANYGGKRGMIALAVLVVILLLLWRRAFAGNTIENNTVNKLGDVDVSPQYINYNVPGLDVPTLNDPSNWDWMQSTDCACNCDELAWGNSGTTIVNTYPQYTYVVQQLFATAPVNTNFASYVAPPLPTWWYEPGFNVHHEQAMYVYTSDGVTGIMGKYSRSAWMDPMKRGAYNQQTKNVSLQGDDAYINGRHYKHDTSKDKDWNSYAKAVTANRNVAVSR